MKKGEKRKEELLKIAYRMFITKGFENTSVDEIIKEAGMAKGTYYYYFKSKEEMLEEVIEGMIAEETDKARAIVGSDMDVVQKMVAVIATVRPTEEEMPIGDALNRPENLLMHKKINRKLMDMIVPILSDVAKEGVKSGIFDCQDIPERIKMLLILATELFDEEGATDKDVNVFIDLAEKLLGAKPGTMGFIRSLIN